MSWNESVGVARGGEGNRVDMVDIVAGFGLVLIWKGARYLLVLGEGVLRIPMMRAGLWLWRFTVHFVETGRVPTLWLIF